MTYDLSQKDHAMSNASSVAAHVRTGVSRTTRAIGATSGATGKRRIRAILGILLLAAAPVYAQGILNPEGRLQLFTNTGAVCNACTLLFFAAGTSTPQNVYSDSGLTTPVANPLTLDSAGRPSTGLYFSAVSYKITLKAADASTLWTQDNVPGGYNTSILIAGTVATARLGSGSATSSTFLRGDSTWTAPTAGDFNVCDLRLTLTSGTPITVSDVTAATSVYVSPLKGGRCGFYDGSATWTVLTNSEVTISVPATTSTIYDVWCRNNASTIACDTTAWTNDTTRATALTTQNSIYVKTGDTTRRYVGSFRTTTVSGQTEDSFAKRYVWNYYNRVPRVMRVLEPADSWTYTTATLRQANANTANQLDCVIGVAEVRIEATVQATGRNSTGGSAEYFGVSIGEDSTSTSVTGVLMSPNTAFIAGSYAPVAATLRKYPAVGRHTYVWLEYAAAAGTTTWSGDEASAVYMQSGITGSIEG